MGKSNVKIGAPLGNAHLCRSCSNGQFTVGYRESDVLVICTNSSPARLIAFPVCECTEYWDRNRPSYVEMTKLAINFSKGHRKAIAGLRGNGFALVPAAADSDREDNGEDEAALVR